MYVGKKTRHLPKMYFSIHGTGTKIHFHIFHAPHALKKKTPTPCTKIAYVPYFKYPVPPKKKYLLFLKSKYYREILM